MRPAIISAVCISLAGGAVFAQTPAPLTFDVASVKPAAPPTGIAAAIFQSRGGPGTADPERITYTNIPMRQLLLIAYGPIQGFQLVGPGSLESDKYDIAAKIPTGTNREQFNVMLQNLLLDRFNLKVHHETRDEPGYELVVAKGGLKMKEAEDVPGADLPANAGRGGISLSKDKDGLPQLPPGRSTRAILPLGNGRTRISARLQTMSDIVQMCLNQAARTCVDKTGLIGKYDFNLDFARAAIAAPPPAAGVDNQDDPAPDFATAMQQQLGLRLEPKKLSLDVLIVDHVDKVPKEN